MMEVVKLKYARGESGWAVKDPRGTYPLYVPFKSETKAAAYAAELNSAGKLEPFKLRLAWGTDGGDAEETAEYEFNTGGERDMFLAGVERCSSYVSDRDFRASL